MLAESARLYRRDLWASQGTYAEVWLEKDALAGVLYTVTSEWDVPLMVTRGYPSLTFLHEAAEAMPTDKPVVILYFGDHDPSGVDIPRRVLTDLRGFAPAAEIELRPIAVTPEQIGSLRLPTRPTKVTDSRAARFVGESVEVDAIPPRTLRTLAEENITRLLDVHAVEVLEAAETSERTILAGLAKHFGGAG
jgi:hypothetical protein